MLRRTAVLAALLVALTGCGGAEEEPATSSGSPSQSRSESPSTGTPTATPTATPTTPAPKPPPQTLAPTPTPTVQPTTGLAQPQGVKDGSCLAEPGEVMLQYPFRAVTATRIEDIGVYPGAIPVKGAWVTPAGDGAPDLVRAMAWPEGFDDASRATYRWADRKEAVEERLAQGRYHLFVLADLAPGSTIDGLDIAWVAADGDETGALQLDHRVTVGACG